MPNGPIEQPIPRVEDPAKVTGLIKYTADVDCPGVLWGKVLRSPLPHARILNIDTSRARNLPGVKTVITSRDMERDGLRNIDDLVTHTMSLESINKAFDLMYAGESIRSVILYG